MVAYVIPQPVWSIYTEPNGHAGALLYEALKRISVEAYIRIGSACSNRFRSILIHRPIAAYTLHGFVCLYLYTEFISATLSLSLSAHLERRW
jgi:hypothetical protein